MTVIILIILVLFFILIAWSWYNLGETQKIRKVIYIIVSLISIYLITLIIFNISKSGINYQNQEIMKDVKNMLVSIFTGLNGLIIIPHIAKIFGKINNNSEIQKEIINKKTILILVIFIICIIFESGYLKDIQNGILNVYKYNLK